MLAAAAAPLQQVAAVVGSTAAAMATSRRMRGAAASLALCPLSHRPSPCTCCLMHCRLLGCPQGHCRRAGCLTCQGVVWRCLTPLGPLGPGVCRHPLRAPTRPQRQVTIWGSWHHPLQGPTQAAHACGSHGSGSGRRGSRHHGPQACRRRPGRWKGVGKGVAAAEGVTRRRRPLGPRARLQVAVGWRGVQRRPGVALAGQHMAATPQEGRGYPQGVGLRGCHPLALGALGLVSWGASLGRRRRRGPGSRGRHSSNGEEGACVAVTQGCWAVGSTWTASACVYSGAAVVGRGVMVCGVEVVGLC